MSKILTSVVVLAASLAFGQGMAAPVDTAANPILLAQAATEIRLVGGRPPGPGERALPKAGERGVVPVPPGALVKFVDSTFGPADVQIRPAGDDLEMVFENGGVLVLQGFLAALHDGTEPATLELADGTVIPANAFSAREAAAPPLETASGSAAGGGEVFGLVRVVWWLLDRVDLVGRAEASEAAAQEASGEPAAADDPILGQVAAQMLIARNGEIAAAAAEYLERADMLFAEIRRRLEAGVGSQVDAMAAESFSLNAELEKEEAAFALTLAIDAHQDRFGERLEKAAYRTWPSPPPGDLAAISAQVEPGRRAEARRQWRLMTFARKTLPLLEKLQTLALDVREGYLQQFEVAQRTLTEVQSAEEAVYRVRVRLAERTHDLKAAEAWLLAATGQLPESLILRPGWQ